jgi:hypothetical protein
VHEQGKARRRDGLPDHAWGWGARAPFAPVVPVVVLGVLVSARLFFGVRPRFVIKRPGRKRVLLVVEAVGAGSTGF